MNTTNTPSEQDQLKTSIKNHLQGYMDEWRQANEPQQKSGPGRAKILPAFVLWMSVLFCVLHGFTSQLAIWRLIRWTGVGSYGAYAISDQTVYNRLAQGGKEALEELFHQISRGLTERLAPYSQKDLAQFATGVYALDATTLDKMHRMLPTLRELPNGAAQLLGGKMVALFNIRQQQWHTMKYVNDAQQNDKVVARELVESLSKGSLILADMGFFSFAWFDYLTHQGYWWISRVREKTSYVPIHTYYQDATTFDGLVWLGKYRADQAAFSARLVRFRVGQKEYQYITNVLDPVTFPIREIALLYARRWDIEMAFRMVKQYLNLHILWSAKTDIIILQLWAVLIISQVLQAIRLEIAGLAEVDPFDVSLPLLVQYVPQLMLEGKDPIAMIVQDGRSVGLIRPSRRIRIETPTISPENLVPLPEETVLVRQPRYAQRKGTNSYFPPEMRFWENFQVVTKLCYT